MVGEHDDFIPHHMYQLEVRRVQQLLLGSSAERLQGVNSQSVAST